MCIITCSNLKHTHAYTLAHTGMIVTGTCLRTSLAAKELCEATTSYPLYFTAGVCEMVHICS